MIKNSGKPIAIGAETGFAIIDKYDRLNQYDNGTAAFPCRLIKVITRSDAFSVDIDEGTLITFDGGIHKVLITKKRVDGNIVESFVAFQEADDMTNDQVMALIDQYFNQRTFFFSPLNQAPTILRATPGAFASFPGSGSLKVTTANPGANKWIEYSLIGFNDDEPFEIRTGTFTNFKRRVGCFVGPYEVANQTATTCAGIEVGSWMQFPPFPSAPGIAVAQLRIVPTPDGTIEFVVGRSDGSNAVVRSYSLAPLAPHGVYLEMEFDPTAQVVSAFADGVLLGQSLATEYPDFEAGGDGVHFGLFVCTGSNNLGSINAWFSMPQFRAIYAP
jgi:hypothetical protein